jgi:hypothetical protein
MQAGREAEMAFEQRARIPEELNQLVVCQWNPGCGTDTARLRDMPVRTECVVYNPDPAGKLASRVIRLFFMISASGGRLSRPRFTP